MCDGGCAVEPRGGGPPILSIADNKCTFTEGINPDIEIVAYVHLTKTLEFIKAYSVHLKKSKD